MPLMTVSEARLLHSELWARIEAEGIILRAHIRLGSLDPETQGEFFINLLDEPQIHVYRDHRADTVDDYEQELITLAHEYGHAISYRKGQRPRERMPEPAPERTPVDKHAIQGEEARAWTYGREVLVAIGVTDFEAFEKRKADADAIYFRRLGLVHDQ
jgi:hypothetical protein